MRGDVRPRTIRGMNELQTLSNQIADVVASIAPSVVQVQAATGVVFADDVVLTNARALGRDDGLRVRTHDGRTLDAELHGWDPATGLALLRVPGLQATPAKPGSEPARVGNLAVAVARSWSNAVTASVGIVSVIGGPLRTGRGRSIDEVIRTTAPMHEGFAGGAFTDMSGKVIGIATAAAIRGLGVIIPAPIAWKTAAALLEHGRIRRGYLGVAGQPVRLSDDRRALLIIDVQHGSPAESGGLRVGDSIVMFDAEPVEEPEDLLELLTGDRVGKDVPVRVLRGDSVTDLRVTIADRTDRPRE
jgi:S1-C subfamily serine protease